VSRSSSSVLTPRCSAEHQLTKDQAGLLKLRIGRRTRKDTTLSLSLLNTTLQENVTGITPGWAPGVLDFVVVNTVQAAVTDSQDTVVQVGTAGASEDTALVELEGSLVSLNGDGDRADVQGAHHVSIAVGLDVDVAGRSNTGDLGAGRLVAGTSSLGGARCVRIVSFLADTTVLGDPVEGMIHQTTVAAHIGTTVLEVVAVNQVLLGEGDQGAVLVEVSTLKSTSGGERPAGTALALILDRSDSTLGGPINGGSQSGDISSLVDLGSSGWLRALQAQLDVLTPLVLGHVGELVVAKSVGEVLGVVGLNDVIVVGIVGQHLHEVRSRAGGNLVLGQPVEELSLIVGTVVDTGGSNRKLSIKIKNWAIKD